MTEGREDCDPTCSNGPQPPLSVKLGTSTGVGSQSLQWGNNGTGLKQRVFPQTRGTIPQPRRWEVGGLRPGASLPEPVASFQSGL